MVSIRTVSQSGYATTSLGTESRLLPIVFAFSTSIGNGGMYALKSRPVHKSDLRVATALVAML